MNNNQEWFNRLKISSEDRVLMVEKIKSAIEHKYSKLIEKNQEKSI